ncbi:hypothetical protein [Streptomyces sp. ODS28]|uniref:hypothetical protein n=1 Tax=Streptomyces sp. ODS28 TaxID=3136688 RepID=UPI0031E5642E
MLSTLVLPIPAALVDRHDIDPAATDGWMFTTHDVAAAPSGEIYALYEMRRYRNRRRYDRDAENFGYRLLTRYTLEGQPQATAYCDSWPTSRDPSIAGEHSLTLSVLPDGVLAVSGNPDCTTLLAPDLSRILVRYAMPARQPFEGTDPGDPFATSVGVTPEGRLLCVSTEYGVHRYGGSIDNIVSLADGPLSAEHKPNLEAIASLEAAPERHTDVDLRPHVTYQGAPVGRDHRPRPSLGELLDTSPGAPGPLWHKSMLGRPVPLAEDRLIVPVFSRTLRGGSRGLGFGFAVLDDTGKITGRLEGLDPYWESPFTGMCLTVAADPFRGHAFHLNRYGLYAWDADGRLQVKLDTSEKAFKPLIHFTLATCSPRGELLLVHGKQNLILRVPVPERLDDLSGAVETALRAYRTERTALKKQWQPTAWHWVDPLSLVYGL